jgi:DNA-binding MarR family transcriptional regulator
MKTIDDIVKTNFPDNKSRGMVNVMYTASWLNVKHNGFIKKFDLSTEQFNVLRILRGNGSWMTMNDVKSRMIHGTPNITRLTDKLISKGLIERNRCTEDRRIVHVQIIKEGLDLLEKIDVESGEKISFVNEDFTEEDGKKLSELLDKLRG